MQNKLLPYPIHVKSKNHTFSITAEVSSLIPITNFSIELKQLGHKESVRVLSVSGKEDLSFETAGQKIFMYSPDVIGKKGGISTLTFIRKNGDTASLDLILALNGLIRLRKKV